MNRTEFEADLRREGYELREGEIKPNEHRGSHAHEFDAQLFVLEGSITLVFGADRCTYGPGDSCNVPAGTMHEEHTEADGVRYLAGRRAAGVTAPAYRPPLTTTTAATLRASARWISDQVKSAASLPMRHGR